MEFEGVTITRHSNEKITDIIEGLSLDLYAVSPEEVEFQIQNNTEKAEEQIAAFVEAYNELILLLHRGIKAR